MIPILPLAGAAINGFFGRKASRNAISAVALVFCGAAFAVALWIALHFSSASSPYYFPLAHWIRSGSFSVDFEFLSRSVVARHAAGGHRRRLPYSHLLGRVYVGRRREYHRFMSYLNLFMFFMLTLVLAKNYLVMFIGWEGVGEALYLLMASRSRRTRRRRPARRHSGESNWRSSIPDCALPDDQDFASVDLTQVFAAVRTWPRKGAGLVC